MFHRTKWTTALTVGLVSAVLGSFAPALLGDTIYLTNGASIDGMVTGRHEGYIIVSVGNVGTMKISVEEVRTIEKNSRTGYLDPTRGKKPSDIKLPTPPKGPEGQPASGTPKSSEGGDTKVPGAPAVEGGGASGKQPPTASKPDAAVDVELEKQIRDWVEELKRQKTTARTRAERRLLEVAPQAVPEVAKLSTHPFELTRAAAFRILKQAKDLRGVDACIVGLNDTDKFVRKLAWEALKDISGKSYLFPWDETGSEQQRTKAADRWRDWWRKEQDRLKAAEGSPSPPESSSPPVVDDEPGSDS